MQTGREPGSVHTPKLEDTSRQSVIKYEWFFRKTLQKNWVYLVSYYYIVLWTYFMWMFYMDAKSKLFQYPPFSFDYIVFGLDIIRIQYQRLNRSGKNHITNLLVQIILNIPTEI